MTAQLNLLPREIKSGNVAYFSMEIGIDSSMPTYSGGLGILAGDTLRATADFGLPVVGVTLLHRNGPGLFSRYGARAERRVGPNVNRCALRRRPAPATVSGGRARHGRRDDAARAQLQEHRHLTYE